MTVDCRILLVYSALVRELKIHLKKINKISGLEVWIHASRLPEVRERNSDPPPC